jgi:hypothetical protein
MKLFTLLLCILLAACTSDMLQNHSDGNERYIPRLKYPYESSELCRGCHPEQYQQHEVSMHAKAFTNPLFNSQFFSQIVPRALRNPEYIPEARKCIACHAPVVFMNYTGLVSTPAQAASFETGVTCDFCHTLAGYGKNGDFEQVDSRKKQGPFQANGSSSHHAEYSSFMSSDEFCGECHDDTNHIGKGMKSTYAEWKESNQGMRGLACQECHMNKVGFIRNGVAEFASGQAAYLNLGFREKKLEEHEKLYEHSFPGAHSKSQLEDALRLEFKIGTRIADADGMFPFVLEVNNERAAHKMPTGSSDLRFMWLVITATTADGTRIPVSIFRKNTRKGVDFSISGKSPGDTVIIKNDAPKGSRLYRSVFANTAGNQSLFQAENCMIVFDNRLNADEIRNEGYHLKLPDKYSGKVILEAHLYYKGAPSEFTRSMQVPEMTSVKIATQKKEITILNIRMKDLNNDTADKMPR